ncbi:NUDIX domain-containing protein [Arachidicoccus ginsenosidivorans]|uniref:NUDIX domain-containing protein n=1 Tax=Arachidicoccus ginsenosidivorans TaxID=496057 RepID=UPI001CEF5B86|nr:NUDIX domain-containing protein [Arachidicoccus ginsenosidivorans]
MNEFNVRVYGVLIHQGKLLVSDEYIKGAFYTKLPGGGLELGEGTRDCLKREFKEETGLEVEVGQHLYTTDFYQMSAFSANQQIISIYYWVHCSDAAIMSLKTHTAPFDFEGAEKKNPEQDIESFRWLTWDKVTPEIMSLPIDQKVMELIVSQRPVAAQTLSSQPAAYFVQKSPFVVPTEDGKLIEEHFGIAATKGKG